MFPEGVLEQCAITNCLKRSHHSCQTEFEHSQNVDVGLHKHFFVATLEKSKKHPNQIVERMCHRATQLGD